MACGVREDPPAAGIGMQQRGAETEHVRLSLVEVRDFDVQVKLLRVRGVRPPRCAVILDALERQYEARADVQGREVAADRPPRIRLVDHTAEKRPVELCQSRHVRTVQDHALQLADHRSSFPEGTSDAAHSLMLQIRAARPRKT
jgi:hypothetical protein